MRTTRAKQPRIAVGLFLARPADYSLGVGLPVRRFAEDPIAVPIRLSYWTAVALLVAAMVASLAVGRRWETRRPALLFLPAPAGHAETLEFLACTVMEETSFFRVEGRVRNASGRSLTSVLAVAEFTDAAGRLQAQGQAFVDPVVMRPGASGIFRVVVSASSGVAAVSVRFAYPDGSVLGHRYPANGITALVY